MFLDILSARATSQLISPATAFRKPLDQNPAQNGIQSVFGVTMGKGGIGSSAVASVRSKIQPTAGPGHETIRKAVQKNII